jgi:hypothetical protein
VNSLDYKVSNFSMNVETLCLLSTLHTCHTATRPALDPRLQYMFEYIDTGIVTTETYVYNYILYWLIIACPTRGPQPFPKPFLHIMRSTASSFNFKYHLFSLRWESSWLLLLLHLPVTSVLPSIFPSITCFRRQFLCRVRLLFNVCRILLSAWTLDNTS